MKLKFVKSTSKSGIIKADYVKTNDNVADLMTKAVPAPRLKELKDAIGLVQSSSD